MKRIFVLLMVAMMSAAMVNAKTIRGYVSDKDGKPVVGMKMVVDLILVMSVYLGSGFY